MNVKGDGKRNKEKDGDSWKFTLHKLNWLIWNKGWTRLLYSTDAVLCCTSHSELVTKLTIKIQCKQPCVTLSRPTCPTKRRKYINVCRGKAWWFTLNRRQKRGNFSLTTYLINRVVRRVKEEPPLDDKDVNSKGETLYESAQLPEI
jgi:hypothetical protein